MLYIESPSVNPYFNLALEQYVFDNLDRKHEYFMLWQNDNAVIIGKYQNTIAEINHAYVKEHNIKIVRRLSGGGAVYHDMGNVNFTFIVNGENAKDFNFSVFCNPVVKALASMGVEAEIQGRNDIVLSGRKFSGNAQYIKQGRIMHHGTIMFNTDLDVMWHALAAPKDKIDSKGTISKRSMVTNIKPHILKDISTAEFIGALRGFMFAENDLRYYELSSHDLKVVSELQTAVYNTWEWNYGYSPECKIIKERRVEGCGKLQVHIDSEAGLIRKIAFYGDYFGNGDMRDMKNRLIGQRMEETDLREALSGIDIGRYFFKMDLDTFISIILQ